jgi:hypothetical protein
MDKGGHDRTRGRQLPALGDSDSVLADGDDDTREITDRRKQRIGASSDRPATEGTAITVAVIKEHNRTPTDPDRRIRHDFSVAACT